MLAINNQLVNERMTVSDLKPVRTKWVRNKHYDYMIYNLMDFGFIVKSTGRTFHVCFDLVSISLLSIATRAREKKRFSFESFCRGFPLNAFTITGV